MFDFFFFALWVFENKTKKISRKKRDAKHLRFNLPIIKTNFYYSFWDFFFARSFVNDIERELVGKAEQI